MSFYSKAISEGDWIQDITTGEYSIDIPKTEHGINSPEVVSVFESSLTDGFKFVVGNTNVTPDADCKITYNSAINGRIVIRGE